MKIGKYTYEKSTKKGKKLMVTVDGKVIHFGDATQEHYKDRTGIWSSKDHLDKKRREAYLVRSKGIKNKAGILVYKDPSSANYHSRTVLW
jgi:hypothetical protein